jgi:hypothetical protein
MVVLFCESLVMQLSSFLIGKPPYRIEAKLNLLLKIEAGI